MYGPDKMWALEHLNVIAQSDKLISVGMEQMLVQKLRTTE